MMRNMSTSKHLCKVFTLQACSLSNPNSNQSLKGIFQEVKFTAKITSAPGLKFTFQNSNHYRDCNLVDYMVLQRLVIDKFLTPLTK